jgi:hypothetical protein
MKLMDNGYGSLYRADAETEHATWASVGNVLYDEGLIVVLSPHAPYFGREQFELDFRGVHHVHTTKVRITAAGGKHTSSSNPSWNANMSASLQLNEHDPHFVYLTGVNLHDQNMNVVAKATLAQPVTKRTGDKITVRFGWDV